LASAFATTRPTFSSRVRLAGGPGLIPVDDGFANFPLPLVVHIVGAGTYAVVGAF
jgi:hypothetical protein